MAYPITETSPGVVAGEAITKGYLIMPTSGSYNTVEPVAAKTDVAIGVATADAASGEVVQYAKLNGNVRIVYASGSISEGGWLSPDESNDGMVRTGTTGDQICGIANVEAAGAAGEFRALMFQGWLLAA